MIGTMTTRQLNEPLASLEEHGLDSRTLSMLEGKLGIVYIRDLLRYDADDLLDVKEFGPRTVDRLLSALESFRRCG